jgi:parallel beta-helix repeat protein
LVLSPSFSTYSEYEKVTISAINADGSLSLTSPLQYTHYGSSSLTINNQFGTLDTRTRVGHVNRNIKIVPGPDAGWGFSVIVYGFKDGDIMRIGNINLDGVQLADGGQLDTLNAPLTFINTVNGNYASSVTSSSFLNCKANCIYIQNAHNITIDNNVFYDAWVIGIEANNVKSTKITNNLIIGVY